MTEPLAPRRNVLKASWSACVSEWTGQKSPTAASIGLSGREKHWSQGRRRRKPDRVSLCCMAVVVNILCLSHLCSRQAKEASSRIRFTYEPTACLARSV